MFIAAVPAGSLVGAAQGGGSTDSGLTIFDGEGDEGSRILAEDLVPGDTLRHSVRIELPADAPEGDIGVVLEDLIDRENGCASPELSAGDGSCGDPGQGDGELSSQLVLSLAPGASVPDGCGPAGSFEPVVGRLVDAVGEPMTVGGAGDIDDDGGYCFHLETRFLELSADNDLAQGDSSRFEVAAGVLEDDGPPPTGQPSEDDGESTGTGALVLEIAGDQRSTDVLAEVLALTGLSPGGLVMSGVAAVLLGWLVLLRRGSRASR